MSPLARPVFMLLLLASFLPTASEATSVCAWVVGLRKGVAGQGAMDYIDSSQKFDTLSKGGRALLGNVIDHLVWLEKNRAVPLFRKEFEFWSPRFAKGERYLQLQAQINATLHQLKELEAADTRSQLKTSVFEVLFPELETLAHELNVHLVHLSSQVNTQNRLINELTSAQQGSLADAFIRLSEWAEKTSPGEEAEAFFYRATSGPSIGFNIRVVNSWELYVARPTQDTRSHFLTCLQEKMDRRHNVVRTSTTSPSLSASSASRLSLDSTYRWLNSVVVRHKILSAKLVRTPFEERELLRAEALVAPIAKYREARDGLHDVALDSLYGANPEQALARFNALEMPAMREGAAGLRDAVVQYRTLTGLDEEFHHRLPERVRGILDDLEGINELTDAQLRIGQVWLRTVTLAATHYENDLDFFSRNGMPADVLAAIAELTQLIETP